MLKVGGIYVAPTEIEEALASHEVIFEAAVVGAPDTGGLIKPRAQVVMKPGLTVDDELESALEAHVKARLAPHKYPRWIACAEALPNTATGEIQRFRQQEPS